MEKVFLFQGLDCPHCAAVIEREVGELDGVHTSVMNLMQQTLTIDVDAPSSASVAKHIETIVHIHEPHVQVSEKTALAITKTYLLKGLDCPNCSAKIEKEVGHLDGVNSSAVNLMKQTLTICVDVSSADIVAKQIEAIVYSHEPEPSWLRSPVSMFTKWHPSYFCCSASSTPSCIARNWVQSVGCCWG